jgi:hypothetical protein
MRIIAPMMILIMMTSTLAGCTGGDPDSGGGIDSDAVNELIDQNLQDFINNTTITVNQEIHHHYYNNSTVNEGDLTNNDYTVEYNNTTVNEGDSIVNEGDDNNLNEWSNTSYDLGGATFGNGVNGTVYGSSNMMFVAHLEFNAMDYFPEVETIDYRNNSFTYNWTYYDYLTNSERNDVFSFSCSVFYLIGSLSNGSSFQVSFWEDSNNYYNAWENEYNSTIANLLNDAGQNNSIRTICDESYAGIFPLMSGNDESPTFLSIDVPIGYAIRYIQIDTSHTYYGCGSTWSQDEGCTNPGNRSQTNFYEYSEGVSPTSNYDLYYGGWENITIDYDINIMSYGEINGYDETHPYWNWGYGYYSMWTSSEYVFTMYYQFVPVIPVE